MITNQFLKIWLLSDNILHFIEILLIFLILRRSRMNEVDCRIYTQHFVNIASNWAIIQDNTFFRLPVWNHIMNINEVKHGKCD